MQGEEVRVGRGGRKVVAEQERERKEGVPGGGYVYRRASASSVYTYKHSNYAVKIFLGVLSFFFPSYRNYTVFLCFAHCSSNRYHLCLVLTGSEGRTDACWKENRKLFSALLLKHVCIQGLGMRMLT